MWRATKIVCCLWLAIFISFFVVSLSIGGDALNGYVANGHYFLGNRHRFTEVGPTVFAYSRWHAMIMMWSLPVAALLAVAFSAMVKAPPGTPRRDLPSDDLRRNLP